MDERHLSELESRTMLVDATLVVSGRHPGRFLVTARRGGQPWTVVLEPDVDNRQLFVVTAFPKGKP